MKFQDSGNLDRAFICFGFQYIRLSLEITVHLGVNERESSCCVLSVFQCFDVGDAASMACEAPYAHIGLFEELIQLFPVSHPV